MKIVDHQEHAWHLIQDGKGFLIEVSCSHSAVDYAYTLRLTPEEISKYFEEGRDYLNWLAHDIHYSAPGVIGSNSKYIKRKVSRVVSEKVSETILKWRSNK